ncbi:MAG: bifunctional diaminohydroxyphosphoribosylaminopyrimidine deaminase/5-amino-6-(5-phosphoribosylamino)uracil reductase RibD [Verrucomicrobiota bacterium]
MSAARDEPWMRRALELALRAEGRTAPNPLVGAVLIKGNRLLGEGVHRRAGGPHAEVAAVRDAKRRGHAAALKGATMFVTLEPCSTHGRTPPCTDLILEHRLGRVVVGATDPNPAHAGRGLTLLRRRGVKVASVLAAECEAINRDWNHFITTGRPWVVAKSAMSLDGRIASPAADSPWLTSAPALRLAHELRLRAGAIVVGAETVRADNPRLTVRLPQRRMAGKEQPWRVVMTRSGRLPKKCHLLTDEHLERTIVAQGPSLREVLAELASLDVVNVLLEGGGRLLGEAFAAGLVNELACFHAPCLLGQGACGVELPAGHRLRKRLPVEILERRAVGPDLFTRALL